MLSLLSASKKANKLYAFSYSQEPPASSIVEQEEQQLSKLKCYHALARWDNLGSEVSVALGQLNEGAWQDEVARQHLYRYEAEAAIGRLDWSALVTAAEKIHIDLTRDCPDEKPVYIKALAELHRYARSPIFYSPKTDGLMSLHLAEATSRQ